jgi:hypothetical protein
MALEIAGKIIHVLPEQSGTGKNGPWSKQDFIIETQEQYPRKVCFAAWGDKVQVLKSLKAGAVVSVSFNAESREFNGKWYTDLKVWKIESRDQAVDKNIKEVPADAGLEPFIADDHEAAVENDLPF